MPTLDRLKDVSTIKSLKDLPVQNPLDESAHGEGPSRFEALKQTLAECGLSPHGEHNGVLWIQNPSHGHKNMFSTKGKIDITPIGYAFCRLFDSAQRGDTINIVNKYIGSEGFEMIANALRRGCNVNFLISAKSKRSLERKAEDFFRRQKTDDFGVLTVKPFLPDDEFSADQHFNNKKSPVIHGKTYILAKPDGVRVIMTGTYNLNGQSYWRSNENMMLMTTRNTELSKALFDRIFDGSSGAVSRYPQRASPAPIACLSVLPC